MRALLAALLLCGFTQSDKVSLEEAGVVRVQFVPSTHWGIDRGQTARALRTDGGQKWILVNLDADQTDFESWYLHEMAHHIAWERHGEDIAPHGPEFRTICRELVRQRTNHFCKGY
jgi:hypothetical protein